MSYKAAFHPHELLVGRPGPDELPLWLPGDDYAGMARADTRRAREAGLTFRALEETVVDTLAWDRTVPGDRPTLTPEKEAAVLASSD